MKIHAEFQQKNGGDPTVEWLLARCGVVTASEFSSLVTPLGKVSEGKGVFTYLCEKLAERWIGGPLPSFYASACEQGSILEEEAIPFAALDYNLDIQQVGFVAMDGARVGCSPDGLIGFNGLSKDQPTDYHLTGSESGIEIKCPNLETHIKYLLKNELPADYVAQVQGSMFVTGCATWHFLSYRRKLPALHLVIGRDEKYHAALAEALESFNDQLDEAMEKLVKINGGLPDQKHRGNVPFTMPALQTIGDDLGATL
jgi:hypothetical protein